jgi:hypothetical protein
VDCELTDSERRRYDAWLHSPSVYSQFPEETILAYKIARLLHTIPSKTLRALRGGEPQDAALSSRIEAFVQAEPGISFKGETPRRRVVMVEK